MGDPKKHRKKYQTPMHPWNKQAIEEEREITHEFSLKNKKEIWRARSILRKFSNQAKRLIPLSTAQAAKEKKQLLLKLERYGLLNSGAVLEDALALNIRSILNRRLQTIIYKNKLALSIKQARQFIVHQHIMVGDKVVTSPCYLVPTCEESLIRFAPKSLLSDPNHPSRQIPQTAEEVAEKAKEIDAKKAKEGEQHTISESSKNNSSVPSNGSRDSKKERSKPKFKAEKSRSKPKAPEVKK